jgi:sugar O-acyltransferase (sialic acid O-acetyltransferase NeuD family)
MDKAVIIFGVNSIGKSALAIFESHGIVVYGFLDENEALHQKEINNVPVLGGLENKEYIKLIGKECEAFIATDDASLRKNLVGVLQKKQKRVPLNAVHETAYISQYAKIEQGNFINGQVFINANAQIGHHCNIHAKVLIDSDAKVGDFVQIGANSNINAACQIGEGAFIGSGVTVIAGIKIGKKARIGAGSVVIADVKDGQTVWGNPAKAI